MGLMKGIGVERMLSGRGAVARAAASARIQSRGFISMDISTDWFFDRPRIRSMIRGPKLRYLNRAGATTRRIARGSIKRKGKARAMPKKYTKTGKVSKAWLAWQQETWTRPASPPGSPIFTHTGAAKEAVLYAYDPAVESAVVGYSVAGFGTIGELHEYGGTRFGKRYPARPVMQPALKNVQPQLPKFWADSIK